MTEKLKQIVLYLLTKENIKFENEQHFQAFMYYVYGWHLGITGLEIVELTWFAHAEGPWSPEVSEAYKILIVEQPVEI